MKDRGQPQIALADAEGVFGLGELGIPTPQFGRVLLGAVKAPQPAADAPLDGTGIFGRAGFIELRGQARAAQRFQAARTMTILCHPKAVRPQDRAESE